MLTSSKTLNLRFPGQYADAENANNYNMMRNYDPTIGRYIEADPIGLDGSTVANMNLYGYANQNALRYTDPDGLFAPAIPLGTLLLDAALDAIALYNLVQAIPTQDVPGFMADNPSDDAKKQAAPSADKLCTNTQSNPDPDDENDKQKKGRPGDNKRQNKQVEDAAKQARLNSDQNRRLGRIVEKESRQYGANLSYQDILEIAREIKNGTY